MVPASKAANGIEANLARLGAVIVERIQALIFIGTCHFISIVASIASAREGSINIGALCV